MLDLGVISSTVNCQFVTQMSLNCITAETVCKLTLVMPPVSK